MIRSMIRGFACLLLSALMADRVAAQAIPYGANDEAGRYVDAGDARIYYEVYGSGEPLLLLHGGLYGYISEFDRYLPLLSKEFKVIAVATRAHGRSEIGTQPLTYRLFAEDAVRVLRQEGIDSAMVMGFSTGSSVAAIIAAEYPQYATKAVLLAGTFNTAGNRPSSLQNTWNMDGEAFEKTMPDFLRKRKSIMPEPERFAEAVDMLRDAFMEPVKLSAEKAALIKTPVLIVAGDRDENAAVENFVTMYNTIPNARLLILPKTGHVGLIYDVPMLTNYVIPFLRGR